MVDENLEDQLVTVPKLAKLLAQDQSFVSEIGLNEFQPHEIVQRLELIIGFVLAMYNTARTIFRSRKGLTLDEKLVQLIYSRVVLMPEVVLNLPDVLEYARKCYEEVKGDTKQSKCTWDNMSLYEKFFAVCVRVFIEELKLDRPDFHLAFPDFENLVSRSLLASAFKGVFSHVKWELDDEVDSTQRSVLSARAPFKAMYESYRIAAKALREKGYSNEEAFWILFAVMSLQPFHEEEDAEALGVENEIRLSEILERQSAIYREEVNREMNSEDTSLFLNLLKEKFDEIRKIVYESHADDYSIALRDLTRVLYRLGGESNIQHAAAATQYILRMSIGLFPDSESLKLVRDV